MILICDCGSTKAEWVLLERNTVVKRFITNGFNPNYTDNSTMNDIVKEVSDSIDNQDVNNTFFYGSGCGSAANQVRVKLIISKFFNKSNVEVYPDTLGACHALFGNNPGVACILGTGSNACVYDGDNITQSVVSLGFMLGDEGSGCHIGKRIVHDYFLGLMPEDLRMKFDAKYHLDRDVFLKKVYQGQQPSRYLAEFCKFAGENIDNQYVKKAVSSCFEGFINNLNVGTWRAASVQNVSFVGSVAYNFKDILTECLDNHRIKCGKILQCPMDGLIEFYQEAIA